LADAESAGQLDHRPLALAELFHDDAPVRVAKRLEGSTSEGISHGSIIAASLR
jgi:hypothetical protein